MRVDTLTYLYFLNLYISTNFILFFKFEGGHVSTWSYTTSAPAPEFTLYNTKI
jgi:hypothetical protein